MVVKIFISGISGNKEVKKRQQRVLMILDSRTIKYEQIDIAEPGNEEQKDFMQNNSTSLGATVSDTSPRHPLPPQIFNDDAYCGDYDQFDMANEIDELEKFLKMAPDDTLLVSNAEIKLDNGSTENEDETKQEILKTTENALESETSAEKEEQSPQTESDSLEKTNGEVKMENGSESVATEES